jgi:ParB/RepB/Spo0J family partition protein
MITDKYLRIPLTAIEVRRNERQRKSLDVSDLLSSIKRRGVVSPIIVEETNAGYVLVAGERRYTASRELGLADIPARLLSDLSVQERLIIELEENIKREQLFWKDEVLATHKIHQLYHEIHPDWTQERTAEEMGISQGIISIVLRVAEELKLDNKYVHAATGYRAAYNLVARREGRAIDDAMNDLMAPMISSPVSSPVTSSLSGHHLPYVAPPYVAPPESILEADFLDWAPLYTGPPFSFIHCDFPYGIGIDRSEQAGSAQHGSYSDTEDTFWKLCHCLCLNLNRLMTQSAHLMFWCSSSVERLNATINFFRAHAPSLTFNPVPLIWHKTDNRGILPDPKRGPRQVYETALIASRGDRLITKAVSNCYGAPTTKDLHQSEKPEPMLRYFFSMFLDENGRVLDPTCGSGAALRAAESISSNITTLGLEINSEFAHDARVALRKARTLRTLNVAL